LQVYVILIIRSCKEMACALDREAVILSLADQEKRRSPIRSS